MSLARFASRRGIPLEVVLEVFEERAAIRQHLGGYSRDEAERLAVEDVRDMLRKEKRCAGLQSSAPKGS